MKKLIVIRNLFFFSALFLQPAALKNEIETTKLKKQVDEQNLKMKKAKEKVEKIKKKIKKSLEEGDYLNAEKLNKKLDDQVLILENEKIKSKKIEKAWKETWSLFTTKKFLFAQKEINNLLFVHNLMLFLIFWIAAALRHKIFLLCWPNNNWNAKAEFMFVFYMARNLVLLVAYFFSRCNLILHLGRGKTDHCFIYFFIFHILHYFLSIFEDTKHIDKILVFTSFTKYVTNENFAQTGSLRFKIGPKGYNTMGILAFVIFFLGTVGEIYFFLKAKNRNSFYIFISDFILFILIVYSVFFSKEHLALGPAAVVVSNSDENNHAPDINQSAIHNNPSDVESVENQQNDGATDLAQLSRNLAQ